MHYAWHPSPRSRPQRRERCHAVSLLRVCPSRTGAKGGRLTTCRHVFRAGDRLIRENALRVAPETVPRGFLSSRLALRVWRQKRQVDNLSARLPRRGSSDPGKCTSRGTVSGATRIVFVACVAEKGVDRSATSCLWRQTETVRRVSISSSSERTALRREKPRQTALPPLRSAGLARRERLPQRRDKPRLHGWLAYRFFEAYRS
jgi:hypothetical protein